MVELGEDLHFRSDTRASGGCLERNRKFDMLSPPQTPSLTKLLLTSRFQSAVEWAVLPIYDSQSELFFKRTLVSVKV